MTQEPTGLFVLPGCWIHPVLSDSRTLSVCAVRLLRYVRGFIWLLAATGVCTAPQMQGFKVKTTTQLHGQPRTVPLGHTTLRLYALRHGTQGQVPWIAITLTIAVPSRFRIETTELRKELQHAPQGFVDVGLSDVPQTTTAVQRCLPVPKLQTHCRQLEQHSSQTHRHLGRHQTHHHLEQRQRHQRLLQANKKDTRRECLREGACSTAEYAHVPKAGVQPS